MSKQKPTGKPSAELARAKRIRALVACHQKQRDLEAGKEGK